MRPILKIIRNIFIYDKKEFQSKVSDIGFDGKEMKEKDSKKEKRKNNYGGSKSQEEKMDEIHRQENK
ncbi:MAG: hypothetical protein L0I79_07220 [Atopostipes sp.]|nr:hypothetical protein [Atopostipes sp.]